MDSACELFEETLLWLEANYASFQFFIERDIVWTVQTRLIAQARQGGKPYQIFNDYPILPGPRRGFSADIVVANHENVLVAAEFKYEPSHHRQDILKSKFPVVDWKSVLKDKDGAR